MTDLQIVKKYLPESLRLIAEKYTISEIFLQNDVDLVVLILESKSLDTEEEKQNWFNLYAMMNDEQITKLRDILLNEKQKLKEIEEKYEKKKEELKNKYAASWDMNAYNSTIDKIKSKEAAFEAEEQAEADALLQGI